MRCGRWYFVISPGSIPLKSIVSRDVVFTLQEKLFGLDSVKRLYLVTGIIIQSGTTEDKSAFVIRKDSEGVFLLYGNIYARSIIISEMLIGVPEINI